jgi:hypothetical protein
MSETGELTHLDKRGCRAWWRKANAQSAPKLKHKAQLDETPQDMSGNAARRHGLVARLKSYSTHTPFGQG